MNFLQHFLALLVQIFAHTEIGFLLLFFHFLFDLLHFFLAKSVEAKDIVQVLIIDMGVLLVVGFLGFDEFDMQLGPFLEGVVVEGPAWDNPEVVFAPLEFDDEVILALLHSFLKILDELGGIIAEVDVDPFGFGLQYSILIPKNKPHANDL